MITDAYTAEISAVRAQANAIVTSNRAAPDSDIPMMFYDNGESEWVDLGGEDDAEDDAEISHGGGEREDRAQAIFESITMPSYIFPHSLLGYFLTTSRRVVRRRIFNQVWSERLRALHASWNAQMPFLVRAYLRWKYGPTDNDNDGEVTDNETIFHVTAIDITGKSATSI